MLVLCLLFIRLLSALCWFSLTAYFSPECPSSSGKSHLNDVILVNLAYVSKVDTINERSGTPPPLASLNFSKVRTRGSFTQNINRCSLRSRACRWSEDLISSRLFFSSSSPVEPGRKKKTSCHRRTRSAPACRWRASSCSRPFIKRECCLHSRHTFFFFFPFFPRRKRGPDRGCYSFRIRVWTRWSEAKCCVFIDHDFSRKFCSIKDCKWQEKNIVVMDDVIITPPYRADNCRGKEGSALGHVRKIVSSASNMRGKKKIIKMVV